MLRLRSNCSVMLVLPCVLVELIDVEAGDGRELLLERQRDRRGHGLGTGAGQAGLHLRWSGKSTVGRSLTGSSRYDITPKTTMPSMIRVVVIGRLMKRAARFMTSTFGAARPPLTLTRLPGTSRSWPSVTTVSPRRDALADDRSRRPAVTRDRDRPHLHGLIGFDDEHVLALRTGLHGTRRHDDRVRIRWPAGRRR